MVMYSQQELLNQFISLRQKMDEFIREEEIKVKSQSGKPDNTLVNQLNRVKNKRFKAQELIDTLQKIDENQYLKNTETYLKELEEIQAVL